MIKICKRCGCNFNTGYDVIMFCSECQKENKNIIISNPQEIIKKYTDGQIIKKIAKEHNTSVSCIRKILKTNNISKNSRKGKYFKIQLNNQDQKIIQLYSEGKSSIYISNLYNVNYSSIIRILKNNSIEIRKPGGFKEINKNKFINDPLKYQEIFDLYNQGYSIEYIMKIVNMGEMKIKNFLISNNIKIRGIGYYLEGNKSVWWKGGNKEFELLYNITEKQWGKISKNVRKRDDHICQKCGESKRKLDVHHIIPARYADTMTKNDYENLITLCNSCHKIIENKWYNYVEPFRDYLTKNYGYKNYPVDFYKAMQKAELV